MNPPRTQESLRGKWFPTRYCRHPNSPSFSFLDSLFTTIFSSIAQTFTDFHDHGSSNGAALQDMFSGGQWVTPSGDTLGGGTSPMITAVNNALTKQAFAAAVNWSWRNQRVWLMSYKMTQDECTFPSPAPLRNHANVRLKAMERGQQQSRSETLLQRPWLLLPIRLR